MLQYRVDLHGHFLSKLCVNVSGRPQKEHTTAFGSSAASSLSLSSSCLRRLVAFECPVAVLLCTVLSSFSRRSLALIVFFSLAFPFSLFRF